MYRWILIVAVFFSILACGNDTSPPGKIKFTWEIGGAKSCQDVQIKIVECHLLQGNEEALVPPEQAACDKGLEGMLVEEVTPGTYTLLLKGINYQGKSTYSAQQDKVKVSSGKTTVIEKPLVLAMTPATAVLKWVFAEKGLCSTFGVQNVEVSVTDSTSNQISGLQNPYPCDPLPTKENPKGGILLNNLKPNENFSFVVWGLNVEGKRIYWGKKELLTEPGGEYEIVIELKKCEAPDVCK